MSTRRKFLASIAMSAGTAWPVRAAAETAPDGSAPASPAVRYLAPSPNFAVGLAAAVAALDASGGDIVLAPGAYRIAKPLTLSRGWVEKSRAERQPMIRISGYGATFDQTIQVTGRAFHIAGLRVVNAAGTGFAFTRSQQSHFADLQAIDCRQAGFRLGGEKGAQVTFGLWLNCLALGCTGNGWELVADDAASWVNANTFLNCISRSNGGSGLAARSATNRVNYNHFFGMQIEGNAGISVDFRRGARDNDFHGGHFVDKDAKGVAIELGDGHNQMFGGRAVGLVNGGSAVIAQSPAYRGKGMVVRMPASE